MTSQVGPGDHRSEKEQPHVCNSVGSSQKVVILLAHRKYTSRIRVEQKKCFQRRRQILKLVTAVLSTLAALVSAISALSPSRIKLLI